MLLRSAKQAGFFEHAQDRLVKPSIQVPPSGDRDLPSNEENKKKQHSGGDGGDGTNNGMHPLITGLLVTLPAPGETWPIASRVNWLMMASSIFNAIFKSDEENREIEIKQKQ